MTRLEAIETLRANYPDACFERLREAVDAAIEVLKAQDEVGDTISRQAAIDFIDAGSLCNANEPRWSDTEIVNFLKSRPSAQPKQGRWIHDGSRWQNRWVCSECGYKWFFDTAKGMYCPNCGCKMYKEV